MANQTMRIAVLSGMLALSLSSGVSAGDATGEMLSNTCAGCHGTFGNSVGPASPTIAGMEKEAFVETMKGFKEDEIYSTIMGRIAKGYDDDDFEKMAEYFAGQKFVPAKQDFDKKLVAKGTKLHDKYCEKCHAEGGIIVEDEDYSLLAGQWLPYLQYAMEDFRSDARPMPKKMKKKLDKLLEKEGDEGLEAINHYYASQQ